MPNRYAACYLEMNDKLSMDQSPAIELKFHKCVRHSTSDRERRIFFTPPDGQFELMSYRTSQNIKLPFKILTDFTECEGNRLFIRVKLKSLFEKKIVANSVVVKIPTHTTTMMVKASPLLGKAKYISQLEAIIWKISKFQGEFECFLDCEVISIEKSTE
jgi:AP-2 complex subunit mu-1